MFFRPVLAGAVIGTVAANSAARSADRRYQSSALEAEVARANAEALRAQDEANRARKEAEEAKLRNRTQAAVPAVAATNTVNVTVPYGVLPGQSFSISYEGQSYRIGCPLNVTAGQTISVSLPVRQPIVATPAVATAPTTAIYTSQEVHHVQTPSYAATGRDLFNLSYSPTMPSTPSTMDSYELCDVVLDHLVDESNRSIMAHGIISVAKGEQVYLIEGDLINGLGGAYKDYVGVESVTSKKRGKVR
mmetsp:Transcript_1990/g.2849  ORF Transcript_1990/g.2849 Transcript_1990/m.2849 type:complete len:247 (-) Transcript_1990:1051-1791(-)